MKGKDIVNVHEAKTHLSRLLERVASGHEVTIAKAGKPVARLIPASTPSERQLGVDAGRLTVPEDFNNPLPADLLADFEPCES
jgi:prevent-host-death family protein